MNKIKQILALGNFESSSYKTPEFISFSREFKKEFTKELKTIEATDISFNIGHFYISGFFKVGSQWYYFSISDVRSPITEMMYRTAKDNKDFTGGGNRWITIETGMCKNMRIN